MVCVYFIEQNLRSLSSCFEDISKFVNFSGKDISTLPEINLEEFVLNDVPVNPSLFFGIEIIEERIDFMSGYKGTYLANKVCQGSNTKTLVNIWSKQLSKIDISFLNFILDFQEDFLDIIIHFNLRNRLTCIFVFDQRMLKDLLPTHSLGFVCDQTSFYKVFCVNSYFRIVGKFQRSVKNSIDVFIQTSARPRRIAENHLIKHQA